MDDKDMVPSWFRSFVDKFTSKYAEFTAKISDLLHQIEALENRVANLPDIRWMANELLKTREEYQKILTKNAILEETFKIHEERITNCDARINDTKSHVDAIEQHQILSDTLEVKFSGVPKDLDNREAAEKILKAIGHSDLSAQIFGIRDWSPKAAVQSENSSETQTNETKTFVAQFLFTRTRDSVIGRSYKLKYKTCQKMFGCGGEGKVSINAIWPKEVYELYRLALTFSKELNYAKPLIRNLVVCVRETRKSSLIPIRTPLQLLALPPRIS